MKKIALLLAVIVPLGAYARIGVAVFPLENRTGDQLADWVGCAIPDMVYRTLYDIADVQVWDPVFLFSADSVGWRMSSDSLLALHAARWKWQLGVGGGYTIAGDSVWIRMRFAAHQDGRIDRSDLEIAGTLSHIGSAAQRIIAELAAAAGEDGFAARTEFRRLLPARREAYGAYAAGLGFDMHCRYARALSAYAHAADLDKSFGLAHHRMSVIYRAGRLYDKAEVAVRKAYDAIADNPVIVAAYAETVCGRSPQKLRSCIDQHRPLLERTSEGMRVIGLMHIMAGEYQRAIAILTRAVAAGPANLDTDFMLGQAFLSGGQFEAAAGVFSRLIEYRPAYVRYYAFLGDAYRRSGRLMESNNILERALMIAPDNIATLLSLANTYFELGWYRKAEQLLLRAQSLKPSLSEVHVNLGVIYWHLGEQRRARDAFEQAAHGSRHAQAALVNQGNIHFLASDVKGAIKAYRRAAKNGPQNEQVYYNLGMAYIARGKLKDAATCFEEVLFLSPNRLDVVIHQARIAEKLGNVANAEQHYRRIIELAPNHRPALSKLIALLRREQRYEEAVQLIEDFLEQSPRDREFRLLLPRMYREMQWYEVAVMEYDKLARDEQFMNSAAVYLGLGTSMFDLIKYKGNTGYDLAIARLKRARQLDPSDPEPDRIIASIYAEYKQMPSLALDHWKRALELTDDREKREELKALIDGVEQ